MDAWRTEGGPSSFLPSWSSPPLLYVLDWKGELGLRSWIAMGGVALPALGRPWWVVVVVAVAVVVGK